MLLLRTLLVLWVGLWREGTCLIRPTAAPSYPLGVVGHPGAGRPPTKISLSLKRQQNKPGSNGYRAADITAMTKFRGDHLKNIKDERAVIIVPPATRIPVTSVEARQPIGEWRTTLFRQAKVPDPEYWELRYNGEPLDNKATLDDPKIGGEAGETLVPYGAEVLASQLSKPPKAIMLKIELPSGAVKWLEALPITTTIDELSGVITRELHLKRGSFDLYHKDRILGNPHQTLEAAGIAPDALLAAKYRVANVPVLMPDASSLTFSLPLSATAVELLKLVQAKDANVSHLMLENQKIALSTEIKDIRYGPLKPVVAGVPKTQSFLDQQSTPLQVTSHNDALAPSEPMMTLKDSELVDGDMYPASLISGTHESSFDDDTCRAPEPKKLSNGKWHRTDLLKPCCDINIKGLDACASNDETLEALKQYYFTLALVFTIAICILIILVIIVQTFARRVVQRLIKAEDRYMRELVEAAFRQISVVAIAAAALHIVCTWDIIQVKLDNFLFAKTLEVVFFGHNFLGRIEFAFSQIQLLVDDFILVYSAFVLLFAALAYTDFKWLKKAEDLTVEEIVMNYGNTEYVDFVVARYEYIDRVAGREIAGLDPKSCWFMEYYRACLIVTSMTLIRFPNITLLLLLIPIAAMM
eukprot:Gregarina_sp_Poly_1__10219@NODE_709_length_6670_cov_39_483265_g536_i0_p1_GENE_NODE_709_length_6670_cov_39_483265_g536_i0NODE_709_length_6670_cov_39_483265_g536_i0_p1_ORF_typecomplete_len640_score75_93ubiquitin/PF00240_23/3_8ubiquitin/PF00240_23/1_6UBX/PF00789_20/0_43UBX/PF00789_20/2_5e02SieB/PF14163_6/0_16YukD/PF08817_10/61YukD/PF08817_10/76YukD/PF08817_10/7_6e02Baculo_11_kDa/PF06143_11/5_6Baculo_11_kDa/PF06143_11/1_7e02_NODE_709_length_6670_cov_39_483265_g536_i07802699